MIDFLDLVLVGLASYRITRLFVFDHGPKCMFMHIRNWLGVTTDPSGVAVGEPGTFADWISCWACFGLTAGIIATLIVLVPTWGQVILLPFAASTITLLLNVHFVRNGT